MNNISFLDNGFIILKEDEKLASPVAVLYYQHYSDIESLKKQLTANKDNIQCIVSSDNIYKNSIPFGRTQYPELWDYADNVDTLRFLINLR